MQGDIVGCNCGQLFSYSIAKKAEIFSARRAIETGDVVFISSMDAACLNLFTEFLIVHTFERLN